MAIHEGFAALTFMRQDTRTNESRSCVRPDVALCIASDAWALLLGHLRTYGLPQGDWSDLGQSFEGSHRPPDAGE